MDAATLTEAVPWRLNEAAPDQEAHQILFHGVDGMGNDLPDPLPENKPSLEPVEQVAADHSECEQRLRVLEREVHVLTLQLAEEKRAAYQQGFEAGTTQELSKWRDALTRAAMTVAELSTWKPKLRAEVEADAVRLSLAIARKVLRREVGVDPGAIAGLLRVAMEKINARDILRVRVAPKDAVDVRKALTEAGLPDRVEVLEDPGLERGSLLLDTNQGQVDASVETQLSEIEYGLADALERNRN
jgi:flagellar assembly protein FliH